MSDLLIFAVVNLIAAILSGAAGGGGGLISTPVLIILGLSPASAIATAKFGGFGISAGAGVRFFRAKVGFGKGLLVFLLIGSVGAVSGSFALLEFRGNEAFLEKVIGIVILISSILLLLSKNMGVKAKRRSFHIKVIGSMLLTIAVVFQAALGSGIGTLQLLILMGCFGMTALSATATNRAMQLLAATISLAIFMQAGIVDYKFGVVCLVTSFVGGYIGAHIALKKGNRFILILLAITSALLAVKLLLT